MNERTRRGAANACTVATHEIQGSRQVPNYRQYLKNSGNKASLANFINQYLCENVKDKLPTGSSVVLAGGFTEGEVVKQVTEAKVLAFDEVFSSQEEADTRILLHAVYLSNHSRIIIRCEDTDVLILLVYYSSKRLLSPEVYMHAGHSQKFVTSERFIPVHEISNVLGQVICGCLLAVHALTGCDTTCAMFRIGKRKAYKTLSKNFGNIRNLQQFHETDTDACIESARQFVLLMHGKQARKLGQSDTLDDLRFLWATTTDKPASMLPPTEGAFKQHVLRAKYQTAIWCSSDIAKPELLDPVGHGWERNTDNELQLTMYTKDSAPVEMRDITHLYCTDKNCTNPRKCPCALASLGCLDICSCKGDFIKLFLPCMHIPVVEIWQMRGLKFVFLLINQSNVTLRGYITLLYFKQQESNVRIWSLQRKKKGKLPQTKSVSSLDPDISPDEAEEKVRLISQVLELQNTLDGRCVFLKKVKTIIIQLSALFLTDNVI
ncbi:hypothetical protein GQR58_005641 [Nymphon striatum]|nr:hypothetical protein GQR58_005641 [Nymphon striatum]